jgi:hypothetical protein
MKKACEQLTFARMGMMILLWKAPIITPAYWKEIQVFYFAFFKQATIQ